MLWDRALWRVGLITHSSREHSPYSCSLWVGIIVECRDLRVKELYYMAIFEIQISIFRICFVTVWPFPTIHFQIRVIPSHARPSPPTRSGPSPALTAQQSLAWRLARSEFWSLISEMCALKFPLPRIDIPVIAWLISAIARIKFCCENAWNLPIDRA